MALTRKFLKALGLEDDKIEQIIEEHTAVADRMNAEIEKYRTDAEKLPAVQKELDGLKGGEDWKSKHNALKKEFEDYKRDVESKAATAAKSKAYRALIEKAGIKGDKLIDAVLRGVDLSKVELDGENVKDADAVVKSIREEWKDYIGTETVQGAKVDTPPSNTGGAMTREQIMAIKDRTERRAAIAANMNLFESKGV